MNNMNANPKTKALAILNANKPPAASAATTPIDGGQDLAEQMDVSVKHQFVQGTLTKPLSHTPS